MESKAETVSRCGWTRGLVLALSVLAGGMMSGCATLGNWFGAGNGPVLVQQVGAAKDCRGSLDHDAVHVLDTPADVGQLELQRNFRLQFPGPLPAGPFALIEMAPQADHASGMAVSRHAQIDSGTLYLTASYFPSSDALPPGSPCVLVALPEGRYDQVVVSDPTGTRRALASRQRGDESHY